MQPSRKNKSASNTIVDLTKLDILIDNYLATLLDRPDHIKLSDFTKLVQMRQKVAPFVEARATSWGAIDAARAEKLPSQNSAHPAGGEETSG